MLTLLLRFAAAGQLIIAVLATQIARILRWQDDIAAMRPLVREVFLIHKFFLSYTVAFFAVLTWRFAPDIAVGGQHSLTVWLSGGMALFWGIRTVFQWTFYSQEHWRGKRAETAVHWTLTFVYGSWTVLYALGVWR